MTQNKKPDNYQILERNRSDEGLYTLPVYLEDILVSYCCVTNYLKTQWLEIVLIICSQAGGSASGFRWTTQMCTASSGSGRLLCHLGEAPSQFAR